MASITCVELNYLVFRYLQESGFANSAYALGHEAAISRWAIDGNLVPRGALMAFVQKGVQYLKMEVNLSNSDAEVGEDFSFLQPMDLITNDVNKLRLLVEERRKSLRKDGEKESEKEHVRGRKPGRISGREERDKDHIHDGQGNGKDDKPARLKDEKVVKEKEEKSGEEKDDKAGKEKDEKSGKDKDDKTNLQNGLSVREPVVHLEEISTVKKDENGIGASADIAPMDVCPRTPKLGQEISTLDVTIMKGLTYEMASSVGNVPHQKMYMTYQRKLKECKNCEDFISSLTDDILVRILSFLALREAGRTSVLSKRWRYVWANLSDLDLDPTSASFNMSYVESEACTYVRHVNQIVSSSRAPSIDKFGVHYRLDRSYGYNIHTWLDFAMRKNVKDLELNLSGYFGGCPQDGFHLESFARYAGYPSVHSLVSLSLVGAFIGRNFLESVLLNLPNLERLKMKCLLFEYGDLNVVGDLLKLKHLEMVSCHHYRKLEISASNLVSIVYNGDREDLNFSYVPLLYEATFIGPDPILYVRNLHNSGCLSPLTKLTLNTNAISYFMRNPIGCLQFGYLKQLELSFFDNVDQSLLGLTNLLHACPVLHTFKLKRCLMDSSGSHLIKFAERHHHYLNTFAMVGFRGAPADVELVLYLARFAIVFEKVILDPYLPHDGWRPSRQNTIEQIEASRKQAKLLQNQLLAAIRVEVL